MPAEHLGSYFSNHIFRIPDYQRGYAWGEKQLNELWDDLEEIQEEGRGNYKQHYTGTLYLEETTPEEYERWYTTSRFYNVVDGQQRLTSLSILLFELIKIADAGYNEESKEELVKTYIRKKNASGNNTIYKFSYSHQDKNYHFLLNRIFDDKTVVLQDDNLNIYRKNLLFAKEFFSKKLNNLTHHQREILFLKATSSLKFDKRSTEKDLDVQAVFETMNNRGKPLSTLERLKNRLIYLTDKLSSPLEDRKNLRTKINDSWGKIYFYLGQNPNSILDEDDFFSAHLSLYRKPNDSVFSEKLAEEKIFQMFCNRPEKFIKDSSGEKEQQISFQKIENYILKLSESAPLWYDIHNSLNTTIQKILLLTKVKEIKILLLSLLTRYTLPELNLTLEKIEKSLFRNRIPGLWIFDERVIANWARDVYNDIKRVDELDTDLSTLLNTKISVENLTNSMNNLFTYERGPIGFHRWSTLKYFLFEYDNFLKNTFRETSDKVSLEDFDETNIEHILPRSYWDYWKEPIERLVENIETDIDFSKKVLINSLGNLTILKAQKNSSLKNNSWLEKKGRYSTGSYNEIDISKNETWSKKEILSRGMAMLFFLEKKVYGLNLTREECLKLLFMKDYIINSVIN